MFLDTVLLLGSFWVYKEFRPNFDPTKGEYCDKTVYQTAFWALILYYILFLAVVLVLLFFFCFIWITFIRAALQKRKESKKERRSTKQAGIL